MTFHVYGNPEKIQAAIDKARAFSEPLGKKVVITETLSNFNFGSPDFGKQTPGESQLAHYRADLPVLMNSGMGWMSFGLVSKEKNPLSDMDIAIFSSDGVPRPAALFLEKTLKGTETSAPREPAK